MTCQGADAIKKMPALTNIPILQVFLGLANYYQNYIPNLYKLRAPLNDLSKKKVKWNWSVKCRNVFEDIKKILIADLSLAYSDLEVHIVVVSDASEYRIVAVLLHKYKNGKPMIHVSCSLIVVERKYSRIEKEALSIVFAVKIFHRFLHGSFLLQTDQKLFLSVYESKKKLPTHKAN